MGISSHFRILNRQLPSTLAGITCALLLLSTASWSAEPPSVPEKAPEARFRTLSGDTLHLEAYRGKPVLLSFWSTSCAICIQEMPKMKQLYRTLKDAGAEMISITMPYDPPNHVVEATAHHELPFPVAIDLDGQLMDSFKIPGTPVKLLISPKGDITNTFTGALDYEKTLETVVAQILK